MAFNGRSCLLIDFSDVHFSLSVRFRTVGPQTPYTAAAEGRREEALEYLGEGRKLLRQ
ncbi:hypothetical protein AH117_004646 [Salmonella enterica subsp. enterica]|nr:hypothetical protein [Salmonella enterica subsp. enterica]EEC0602105.1 hypothetical protein [Salmonella enterica subsp. enterica]